MLIKTADGERNVASKGLGGAALGLAIPGTVALVGQLLGGATRVGTASNVVAGGGCGTDPHDTRVIADLEMQLAQEKSERYADAIGIATFKEAQSMAEKNAQAISNLTQFAYNLDKSIAVDKETTNCNLRYLDNKIDTKSQELVEYVNGRFVPGQLVMPASSICPKPLAASTPIAVAPQVITTTTATTEGEITLNALKK